MKNKIMKQWITLGVIFIIIMISVIFLAYRNEEKYQRISNNSYNYAFYELVDTMQDIENFLVKSLITKEAMHSAETLGYIGREANLAEVYLSQLPIKSQGISKTQKFLNQVSEYSYSLSRRCVAGKDLTEEDIEKLKKLYTFSKQVNETLEQIASEIENGMLNWKDLEKEGSSLFEKEINNLSKEGFDQIERNFKEYDGLIYDGAFSEHVLNTTPKGLTGENIEEKDASKKAMEIVGEKNVQMIKNVGLSQNGNIPVYTFEITTVEKNIVIVAVSKKGGHIVFMNYNRVVEEEILSQEEASKKAESFLTQKGYLHMQKTYTMKEAGVMTINFAYEQEGVIIYPDLIKVKVALDTGDIMGMETTGYLNNHEKRKIEKEGILKKEKVAELASDTIIIEHARLAIIPTEFKTEIFCWELKGTVENREFLLYVNAKTGKIEDILVVIETEKGTITQ